MTSQTSEKLLIFDTTLRDGVNGLPKLLSLEQKMTVARELQLLNVDILEAGFPEVSKEESTTVKKIAEEMTGV